MPEGPSIIILKEEVQQFQGKILKTISTTTDLDIAFLKNKKLLEFKTWGKHLLIRFTGYTIRIHLMMFGDYYVNEQRKNKPKLHLQFANGELNFYACNIKLIEGDLDEVYDWSADIMADEWSSAKAKKKLLEEPDTLVCDALLDQQVFSGSGNIIKNEVLFRVKVHPKSKVGELPAKQLAAMIRETRKYAFEFLKWKKEGTLKKHWEAYTKTICPRDDEPFHKEYLGKNKRRTYYCNKCQKLYT